jgi:hypothetical protein
MSRFLPLMLFFVLDFPDPYFFQILGLNNLAVWSPDIQLTSNTGRH